MPALYLATGKVAGSEISSTYEGRHLTLEESYLTHIAGGDALVNKGAPVNCGSIVGVAFNDAAAATSLIAIDTEGIWFLNVVASDDAGTSAVIPGDRLYIATGVVSKKSSGIPFGWALGNLDASAAAAVCAVKVHGESLNGGLTGHQFVIEHSFIAAAVTAGEGFFIAPAPCAVISAYEAHGTVAGQAGTLQVEKCNTGEAKAAGNVVLASAWDLTSTINVPLSIAHVASAEANLVAGDELRLKLASGAATSLVDAVVTMFMEWL